MKLDENSDAPPAARLSFDDALHEVTDSEQKNTDTRLEQSEVSISTLLPLFLSKKTRGWPKNIDALSVEYISIGELLVTRYQTDAHFAAYSLPSKPHRLTRGALDNGLVIPMPLVVFDIDCPLVHGTPNAPPPEWIDKLRDGLDRLEPVHPSPYCYLTRGGARIVYRMAVPFQLRSQEDAKIWSAYYIELCAYVEREFGIIADRACCDWTRLFRLPHATRDGVGPEERDVHGDAFNVGSFPEMPELLQAARAVAFSEKAKPRRVKGETPLTPKPSPPLTERGVLYRVLEATGNLGPHIEGNKWAIRCPFEHQHTTGSDFDTSTVLFAASKAGQLGYIYCSHNACLGGERPQGEYLSQFSAEELEAAALPDDRSLIKLGTDEHRVADEAVDALKRDPAVFQRGQLLVRVVESLAPLSLVGRDQPLARILPATQPYIRDTLTQVARFVVEKSTEDGTRLFDQHPPSYLPQAIEARRCWDGIRQLTAIVETPVLRYDGTILETPGYDAATGLFFVPTIDFPRVDQMPSREDALVARDVILEIVADFPFAAEHHRAAWLAGVLTPLARHAFDGPAPLLAIDGTTAGVGKGLLASVLAKISTGRVVAAMPPTENDAEERKRITSLAMAGDPIVLIDNITGPFGSEALESLLTTTHWRDRILGGQTMFEGHVSAFWMVTGNNLNFARRDMLRRVLHVRLQSPEEHPEQRASFKQPNLLRAVESQRASLTFAALTILAAFCAAGRPSQSLPSWGSFEGWSDLVRSAVVWVGLEDPAAGKRELAGVADTSTLGLYALLTAWCAACSACGAEGLTAAKALEYASGQSLRGRSPESMALKEAILELCPSPVSQLPNAARLGTKLRASRDRVVGGLMFQHKTVRGDNVWRAVRSSGESKVPEACSKGDGRVDVGDMVDLPSGAESQVGVVSAEIAERGTERLNRRSKRLDVHHIPPPPRSRIRARLPKKRPTMNFNRLSMGFFLAVHLCRCCAFRGSVSAAPAAPCTPGQRGGE